MHDDGYARDDQLSIKVFGIVVSRKTDILAIAAFLIAIVGTISQSASFFRGMEVQLAAPEKIILFFDTYPNGNTMVRIASSMSYVNQGEAPYGAIIKSEEVSFEIGSKKYHQKGQSFQNLNRNTSHLELKYISDAQPFLVPGASSVSHTTVFAPYEMRCSKVSIPCDQFANFLSKNDFIKGIGDQKDLNITFSAIILGQKTPLIAKCSIELNDGLFALMLMNRWYTAPCWEAQE